MSNREIVLVVVGARRKGCGLAKDSPRPREVCHVPPNSWPWQSASTNSSAGRWISEDPIGFDAGDYNINRYVGNGPTNAIDPSGLVGIADPYPQAPPPGYEPTLIDEPGIVREQSTGEKIIRGIIRIRRDWGLIKKHGVDFAAVESGIMQGTANSIQGVQDGLVFIANVPVFLYNLEVDVLEKTGVINAEDDMHVDYSESPQWARGKHAEETDLEHAISKGAGGAGLDILIGLGVKRVLDAIRVGGRFGGTLGKIDDVPANSLDNTIDDAMPNSTLEDAAPKETGKHWTDFADEAGRRREDTIRRWDLKPDADIKAMARKSDIKAIDRIVKEEGLTRGQRRLLHDEITGQNFSLEEIREIAREIKVLYPNK